MTIMVLNAARLCASTLPGGTFQDASSSRTLIRPPCDFRPENSKEPPKAQTSPNPFSLHWQPFTTQTEVHKAHDKHQLKPLIYMGKKA